MPRIENVKAVQRKLRDLIAKSMKKDIGGVIVGYTAAYAIYVHENMNAKHTVGQAKFLEKPAREKRDVLAALVATAAKAGVGLQKALVIAGLRLKRESQELVPVDTGNLKGSAFVEED